MDQNQAELQVLQGNSQFTTNLYKILSEQEGNVFFSPISIHAVLSMVYQGAQDSTAQALATTLQIPEAKTAGEGYLEILKRLNSVENVTLLMANKIFLKNGKSLLEAFGDAVTKNFLSEVQLVDFEQNKEAAKTINTWVEEQTKDKIKDLINAADLDALTRLVLINAIYFKGNWLYKFKKEDTRTELFYLSDVDTVDVQMMHINKKFNYKKDEGLDAQILELPYTNEDLSMIVLLPNQRNGIKDLEQKLANVNLADITDGLRRTEMNVVLPKFKIENTIDLQDSLTKLGLGEIFDESKANFRGMLADGEPLYVSKVIQKAFIEVNEEGAEAAAATSVRVIKKKKGVRRRHFAADHPFIIILKFKNNYLFCGRISEPKSGDTWTAPRVTSEYFDEDEIISVL